MKTLTRALAAVCITVAQSLPVFAAEQSVGGTCSPVGSMSPYETNGILVCSAKGTWKPLYKSVQPSEFGSNGPVLQEVQDRLVRGMRAIVEGVRDKIADVAN